jgi:hypothetical protein
MFYIYAYIDPKTDQPFYIGKGTGSRKFDHLNETSSKKENREKWKIIEELLHAGTPPTIVELESNIESESLAFDREDYYILHYGRKGIDPNGILVNKTIGGKQPPKPVWDENKKKRHSEWNKTYWTEERRKSHRIGVGTVPVTDKMGNSKRIPQSIYDSIDKSGTIDTWEYVPVASKESKRRKLKNQW